MMEKRREMRTEGVRKGDMCSERRSELGDMSVRKR
jgi:hypothetical protein